jgi:hypothetical protein
LNDRAISVKEEAPRATRRPPRIFIKEEERVAGQTYRLMHPSGRFSIAVVGDARRDTFLRRFYTMARIADPGPIVVSKAPGGATRAALIARAKELGIPAKGTNEALAAAIAEAEA